MSTGTSTTPTTTPRLLASAVAQFGDATAIVDDDVRLTWHELAAEVNRAARAFVSAGVEPGDRIGIWAPNMWEWPVALLGLQSAGGVLVPLNTRFKGAEAAWILAKSRTRLLVTVDGFVGNDYRAMLRDAGGAGVERVVVLRSESWSDFLEAGNDAAADEVTRRVAMIGSDDVADLLFTSGTTGKPKGVIAAHGQAVRCVRNWANGVGLRSDDRYLIINPFFHSFGYKAGILACLTTGATMYPLPTFDTAAMLHLIESEHISMLPGPPSIYQTLLELPDRAEHELSSLRLAVTGAAAIPVELVRRMRDELGFDTVVTAYGLTEANGFVTMCHHDDDAETIATTSGRAMPDVEVRIVDDRGVEVSRGNPGEIVARGYNVMRGYFEEPEQTADVIDAEGWLHTGDIGVMDELGNVRITDRKKDMFIVGGFNAYPAEIENLLCDHPAVAQAAVVGMPDDRLGEVGAAFVVRRSGADVTSDELTAWSREHMANYKVPRRIEFVEALPLNASGKVLKYELRSAVASGQEAPNYP